MSVVHNMLVNHIQLINCVGWYNISYKMVYSNTNKLRVSHRYIVSCLC